MNKVEFVHLTIKMILKSKSKSQIKSIHAKLVSEKKEILLRGNPQGAFNLKEI